MSEYPPAVSHIDVTEIHIVTVLNASITWMGELQPKIFQEGSYQHAYNGACETQP
jgi:hypothetical protein